MATEHLDCLLETQLRNANKCQAYDIQEAAHELWLLKEKIHSVKDLVELWLHKQGHEKCHYYPDLFRQLALIVEVSVPEKDYLPLREEFQLGCTKYQDELYGEEGK